MPYVRIYFATFAVFPSGPSSTVCVRICGSIFCVWTRRDFFLWKQQQSRIAQCISFWDLSFFQSREHGLDWNQNPIARDGTPNPCNSARRQGIRLTTLGTSNVNGPKAVDWCNVPSLPKWSSKERSFMPRCGNPLGIGRRDACDSCSGTRSAFVADATIIGRLYKKYIYCPYVQCSTWNPGVGSDSSFVVGCSASSTH